ncbi:hypothetical protein GE09DRAFT_1143799 [Coniochaeta sp. 2T2.1]|nr:hypothetical protein GE09DRAFT_1143799 [Coniochaeta sp. 2T2.1]
MVTLDARGPVRLTLGLTLFTIWTLTSLGQHNKGMALALLGREPAACRLCMPCSSYQVSRGNLLLDIRCPSRQTPRRCISVEASTCWCLRISGPV